MKIQSSVRNRATPPSFEVQN